MLEEETAAQLQAFFRSAALTRNSGAAANQRSFAADASRGEVVEWLKAPASKAGRRDERLESSNLSLSEVKEYPGTPPGCFFILRGGTTFECSRRSSAQARSAGAVLNRKKKSPGVEARAFVCAVACLRCGGCAPAPEPSASARLPCAGGKHRDFAKRSIADSCRQPIRLETYSALLRALLSIG